MCIFIVVLMGILLFYMSAEIDNYKLIEIVDTLAIDLESGWEIFVVLWPAMAFMFGAVLDN